jgi:hypothetical protein
MVNFDIPVKSRKSRHCEECNDDAILFFSTTYNRRDCFASPSMTPRGTLYRSVIIIYKLDTFAPTDVVGSAFSVLRYRQVKTKKQGVKGECVFWGLWQNKPEKSFHSPAPCGQAPFDSAQDRLGVQSFFRSHTRKSPPGLPLNKSEESF